MVIKCTIRKVKHGMNVAGFMNKFKSLLLMTLFNYVTEI